MFRRVYAVEAVDGAADVERVAVDSAGFGKGGEGGENEDDEKSHGVRLRGYVPSRQLGWLGMVAMEIVDSEFAEFLEDISECFIQRDAMRWAKRVKLPFSIITRDGPVVMTSVEDVRANFNHYLEACEIMSLDIISRRPISLENCPDGTCLGTYETRLLTGGLLATAPYISTALLLREKGVVQMSSILNGRGHHEWTGRPIGS